jgi:16S rRNA (uracil1498-N3)-methyltransferase
VPAWVWVPELAAPGASLTLDAETAHHVLRVCRARPGDRVTLTDGRGLSAAAERVPSGAGVVLRIVEVATMPRPIPRILIVGAPEGGRADWLVEKAVELGITALWPADTERAVWRRAGSGRERWLRLARAALGQARRAWLPELAGSEPLDTVLTRAPAEAECWIADPGGSPAGGTHIEMALPQVALVGPAAGLSTAERRRAGDRGFRAICLSSGRLRAETAAMAVCAWWAGFEPGSGGATSGYGPGRLDA